MTSNSIISVATILYNDEKIIESYVRETTEILSLQFENYELVLVDNGSSDLTVEGIKKLQKEKVNIRLVCLSKRYEDEYARMAALDHCIGDYVVLMDVNSDPPTAIPQMLESAKDFDIVIGERTHRNQERLIDSIFARGFYQVSKMLTGYQIDPNQSDFVVLNRKTVNSLVQIRDRSRYLKYLKLEVGYKRTFMRYDQIMRDNRRRKRSLYDSFGFAFEMIITNSDKLLRTAALIGFLVSFLNLVYVLYVLLIAAFKRNVAEGWTTTSLLNSMMFCILFAILSIISIYLSSILKETKKGPLYYVADETNSSVIYKNIDKTNVV